MMAATQAGQILIRGTRTRLASRAFVACTLRARLIGLLGRPALPEGDALVFPGCNSIHTFGMRFPIDVVFVDRSWRVVDVREAMRPWRIATPVWKAWGVVEMAAGSLKRVALEVGDQLTLSATGCDG